MAGTSDYLLPMEQISDITFTRLDEKAGLQRDAIRSQLFDVLEAQKKETGNAED